MRRSIRWRLSLWQVVIISTAMAVVALAGQHSLRRYYLSRLEHHLFRQANLIRHALQPTLVAGLPARRLRREVQRLGYETAARVTLIAPDGSVLGDSGRGAGDSANITAQPEVAQILGQPLPGPGRRARAVRSRGMHIAVPILREGNLLGVVRVSLSLDDLEEELRGFRSLLLGTVLLTTLLAVAVTLTMTGSVTGPIREVTEVARRMAGGDLARRVVSHPDNEMGGLVVSFNTMAARIQEMKAELEGRKAQIGLQPEQQPFGSFARRWLGLEYQRNRFDAPAALRLLALAANQPIDDRIELLRIPLRMGPAPLGIQAAFEAAVRQLVAGEPASFAHRMEALLPLAVATTSQPDVNRWPDPYAPETLRLQAMALRAKGDFGQSAALTARAAQMHESEELRARYPTALSCALLDHARAQFLAEPDQPAKAADACRRALELWPDSVDRSMEIQPLQRELSLYLLAGGDEGGAADLLRAQAGPIPEEVMARNVGYGLAEICGRLVERAPSERPAAFQRWLARSVELAPDFPTARWLAAQVALEGGLGAQAVEHLKAVEANLQNPQQFGMMLEAMAKRFPESSELKSYVQARAASAPADDDVDTPTSGPSAR